MFNFLFSTLYCQQCITNNVIVGNTASNIEKIKPIRNDTNILKNTCSIENLHDSDCHQKI